MTLRGLIDSLITQIDTQPGSMEVRTVAVDEYGNESFVEITTVQVEEVEGVQVVTLR